MLEINEKQLLSYDNANRARIVKYIALGIIKYIREDDYYDRKDNEIIGKRKIK